MWPALSRPSSGMQRIHLLWLATLIGCHAERRPATPVCPAPPHFTVSALAVPGAGPDGIFLDYLGFDPMTGFVWVPAGPTGSVDIVDTATGKLSRIEGFP